MSRRLITYDNITLAPSLLSTVFHRSDCNTSVELTRNIHLKVPLIASPMPDVCGGEMASVLSNCGAMGIIHRFMSIERQVESFKYALNPKHLSVGGIGAAIGVTGDFVQRFEALWNVGCRIFCLDTANGANVQVGGAMAALSSLWSTWPDAEYYAPYIIAGSVATIEGYNYLANLGVDAVRVGIAGGSVCETKEETGVYLPTLESVHRCHEFRTVNELKKAPLIIADGGIRTPADMCKALAIGADLVMAGRIFAGYDETPGAVQKYDGRLYKRYRGAASYGVQHEYTEEKPTYSEGDETLVPFVNQSSEKVVSKFKAGLQSSMSYMNARTLAEYRTNVTIETL